MSVPLSLQFPCYWSPPALPFPRTTLPPVLQSHAVSSSLTFTTRHETEIELCYYRFLRLCVSVALYRVSRYLDVLFLSLCGSLSSHHRPYGSSSWVVFFFYLSSSSCCACVLIFHVALLRLPSPPSLIVYHRLPSSWPDMLPDVNTAGASSPSGR